MKTKYEPSPGTHIRRACEDACKIANEIGTEIRFRFNDIDLAAQHGMIAAELEVEFYRKCEERRKAYQESDEGKAAAKKREQEIADKNSAVRYLISALPEILRGGVMADLMLWLESFTHSADDVAVNYNKEYVAALLESGRYCENYGVGRDSEWFDDRNNMGRYIVGQAISCLRNGMPPHGITLSFIEKWMALPQ